MCPPLDGCGGVLSGATMAKVFHELLQCAIDLEDRLLDAPEASRDTEAMVRVELAEHITRAVAILRALSADERLTD